MADFPNCMHPCVLLPVFPSASTFPQHIPYHTGRGSGRPHLPVSPWGGVLLGEYQWDRQHKVKWEDIRVLDRAIRPVQLKVKPYTLKKPTVSTRMGVTSYRAAGSQLESTKILCGQLMLGVQLANVSTRYLSHPQGNSEARYENDGNL